MQSETYLDLFILIWVHLTRLVHGCIRFSRGATSTRLAPSLIPPPPPRRPSSRDASKLWSTGTFYLYFDCCLKALARRTDRANERKLRPIAPAPPLVSSFNLVVWSFRSLERSCRGSNSPLSDAALLLLVGGACRSRELILLADSLIVVGGSASVKRCELAFEHEDLLPDRR